MAFKVDDKKLKRAGLDYWHLLDITFYEDIFDFFRKVSGGKLFYETGTNKKVVGVACNSMSEAYFALDTSGYEFYYFTTKAPNIYTEPVYKDNAYLFFGSETKGLDEALLYENPSQCVRFPMLPDARSMNLSNAVAIGVFEVLRQWNFPNLQNHGKMAE